MLAVIDGDRTLTVGTGARSIRVSLTEKAARVLDEWPGGSPDGSLGDHLSLLTTIAVGRAAAGRLHDNALLIDACDIIAAVEHSGPPLGGRHIVAPRMRT